MTLQQIEYIVALNRHRHFVKAAEECGVTQPTLSAMVQKLEEELDVKIFDRSKHPIEPTAIGEKIIRQAETTLNEMRRIQEVVDNETNSLTGTTDVKISGEGVAIDATKSLALTGADPNNGVTINNGALVVT